MNRHGFIRFPRELLRHPLWAHEPYSRALAFIDLLCLASFKERTVIIKNKSVYLKKGELAVTILWLSKRWNRSRHFVRNTLDHLASRGLIELSSYNSTTVIRILIEY